MSGEGRPYDVAILGGGLAGLSLAVQLKRQRPQTTIVVLEKRKGPAPLAAFKVGESTVPAASEYFAETIGMREHLETKQIIKCGLRYFLPGAGAKTIVARVEFGPDRYPPHDNYQIDRGLFENALAKRASELGADVLQGCHIEDLTLGRGVHQVRWSAGSKDCSLEARWLVDASGRAGILKRKLGLQREVAHNCNAAWFRLRGGLDIEDWGRQDPDWMNRMCRPGLRQYSTNHLMDEGYWVWLIPLSSGHISIGICADPRIHPFEEINRLDRFLKWLRVHEPEVSAVVDTRREEIDDFLTRRDFAYGVERAYSTDRWCLVGEAAAFSDAFYSPGSDLIAFGNLVSGDLIARDLEGEDVSERVQYFNDLYDRTFEYVLSKYTDLYPAFGNTWVMSHKLFWDVILNHSAYTMLMVRGKLTDLGFMRSVDADLDKLYRLSVRMQELFQEWHLLEQRTYPNPLLVGDGIRTVVSATFGLVTRMTDADLREELSREVGNAEAWAVTIFAQATEALRERPLEDRPLNPYAVSLQPERWEADGLYGGTGLLVGEARRLALAIGPPPKPVLIRTVAAKAVRRRWSAVRRSTAARAAGVADAFCRPRDGPGAPGGRQTTEVVERDSTPSQ